MSSATPNSRVSFASLSSNNLGTVRKLNSVLFPIKYSEKFYNDILNPDYEEFCKLVYYNDVPVGTICCRLETKGDQTHLYLMTMGILAPYRSRKLGSESLDLVLRAASSHHQPKIDKIYLHVQISNGDAKRFYERHGFQEVGIHEDYYKKIAPHDAWILEKAISAA
ncbi:N-acetyltransferase NAT13 [Guyanagaster necrorhizus]|uniref:N-acetyltransferase NAT13 n=1 Tax=Guyanagaster necrorhizus TaxID=856835 RepID=A0A9P8ASE3_9AGAR|nr:N-acetyltransferase NAT13 [Guyanagaster necrorhizus MCA 3950]KAG7446313.1 N-acetyltransferase NAT13 [Guyanagaster necrorhizus MCA 3950]